MPALPELYILRHGQTVWNAEGRFQGRLDSALTEIGRAQAAAQGRILKGQTLKNAICWCSPQGRAMATAKIALHGLGPDMKIRDNLAEIGMGDWEGQRRADVSVDRPLHESEEAAFDIYERAPNGEGFDSLERRCVAVIDALHEVTRPVILVTHGITSRMLRTLLTGRSRAELGFVGGGQGIVYHVNAGVQRKLEEKGKEGLAF